MKMNFVPAFAVLLALVGCGNPIFHRGDNGSKAPADPEESIPFTVTAGYWTLNVYAKRKDGPVLATPTTATASGNGFTFGPVLVLPFSKTESLPLALTLEDVSCGAAQDAVAKNGDVNKLEGKDTYSVSSSGSQTAGYSLVETVAVERGDACALLTFTNGSPGKTPLGPLPAVTGLIIYGEASSAKHNG